jgi:hypothetical protein
MAKTKRLLSVFLVIVTGIPAMFAQNLIDDIVSNRLVEAKNKTALVPVNFTKGAFIAKYVARAYFF